eukprot:s2295_g3.t1
MPGNVGRAIRPKSAGARRSASASRIYHGTTNPHPDPGSPMSGPGDFRTFDYQRSKYSEHDPLDHGLRTVASESAYTMSSSKAQFRAIDISKVNAERYQWSKLDTFQTPYGHLGDMEDIEDVGKHGKPTCHFKVELLEQVRSQISKQMKHQIECHTDILLQEMKSIRAEMSANFALLSGDLKDLRNRKVEADFSSFDFSAVVTHFDESKVQVDFDPVLTAIREKSFDVDLTQVLTRIDEKTFDVDFSHVLTRIDEKKVDVDFSSVLTRIDEKKFDVDWSKVLTSIDEVRTAIYEKNFDKDFSGLLDAIRSQKFDVDSSIDFSSVLAHIDAKKIDVDFSDVLARIDAKKSDVDLTSLVARIDDVLTAVREKSFHVDLTSVLTRIDEKKVDVDFSSVLTRIDEKKLDIDLSSMSARFDEVLHAVNSITIPAAPGPSVVDVDITSVLTRIDEKKLDVDFKEILGPIRDLSASLTRIENKRVDVDFSQVIRAIREQKFDIDFAPVLAAIHGKKTEVDFSRVLAAIDANRVDLSQVKVDIDFTAVMRAIEANRDLKLDVDFSAVLTAIENIKVDVDISEVLQTIRQHSDPQPILDAIANMSASFTARIHTGGLEAWDETVAAIDQLHLKLEDIDKNGEQAKALVHAFRSNIDASLSAYHQESMLELSKLVNIVTRSSSSSAVFRQEATRIEAEVAVTGSTASGTPQVALHVDIAFEILRPMRRRLQSHIMPEKLNGYNQVFCKGRFIAGPDARSSALSVLMILVPSILWQIFVGAFFADQYGVLLPLFAFLLQVGSLGLLLATAFSDPGIMPRQKDFTEHYDERAKVFRTREPQRFYDVILRGHPFKLKYCKTCNIYRPPRCTHCSVCENCVERNCIGKRNYRLFFGFVSVTGALNILVLATAAAQLGVRATQLAEEHCFSFPESTIPLN